MRQRTRESAHNDQASHAAMRLSIRLTPVSRSLDSSITTPLYSITVSRTLRQPLRKQPFAITAYPDSSKRRSRARPQRYRAVVRRAAQSRTKRWRWATTGPAQAPRHPFYNSPVRGQNLRRADDDEDDPRDHQGVDAWRLERSRSLPHHHVGLASPHRYDKRYEPHTPYRPHKATHTPTNRALPKQCPKINSPRTGTTDARRDDGSMLFLTFTVNV
jgi:hypothetical protein